MPGDGWQKFANLRLLYAYYMIHPGKKLLFMGGEFAQGIEWRHDYGLEWQLLEVEPHSKMKDYVKNLNYLYRSEKSLYEVDDSYEGFDFIDPHNDQDSIIVLMRKGKKEKEFIIGILNFTPVVRYDYKVGVPYMGVYEEVFNSDDEKYWGSGQTMGDAKIYSTDEKWHNQPYHINIKVPPLGATFIKMTEEIIIPEEEEPETEEIIIPEEVSENHKLSKDDKLQMDTVDIQKNNPKAKNQKLKKGKKKNKKRK